MTKRKTEKSKAMAGEPVGGNAVLDGPTFPTPPSEIYPNLAWDVHRARKLAETASLKRPGRIRQDEGDEQ
jgi:hypothetical protein